MMIVPDINLVLYAEINAFPEHRKARRWWEALLSGVDDVGLTPPVVFAFVRIATNHRMFDPPLSVDEALDRVTTWLEQPHVRMLVPGPRHLEIAFRLLRDIGAAGNLTTDAQLAAFTIENNASLHSNDADFTRFPDLRVQNPLKR